MAEGVRVTVLKGQEEEEGAGDIANANRSESIMFWGYDALRWML